MDVKPKPENKEKFESPENPGDISIDEDGEDPEDSEGSYYYDDAHGYQKYNPDETDDDESSVK